MLSYSVLVVLFVAVRGAQPLGASPLVHTHLGALRGSWWTSDQGRPYAAFTAVPFAKPPIGSRRFEPPETIEPWLGEWDASQPPPSCMALMPGPSNDWTVVGQEDCLYLNVYTPQLPSTDAKTESLPVIVFIHGGGFVFDSGVNYGPKYLMDREVVVVIINYRLGPLGFLSLEDEVQPGNNGLRDQVEALKWVQYHIHNFGGDPESVTLIGLSAGGVSVHYHYLSPLSRGLFHRGISLSGTALSRWGLAEQAREKALRLAASVGCPTQQGSELLIKCLKTRPSDRILEQVAQFQVWQYSPSPTFTPVVEKYGWSPFLAETPAQALAQGTMLKAPWITGVTTAEGLFPAAFFIASESELELLNRNFTSLVPHLLDFNFTVTPDKQQEVANTIREHYFGELPVEDSTVTQLIKMISDRLFLVDGQRAAELQASHSPVYFYQFDFRGARSFSEVLSRTTRNYGVSHGDDMTYFMNCTYIPLEGSRSGQELEVQNLMVDMWTTFAKTGVPTASWSPVTPGGKLEVLHIAGVPPVMTEHSDLGDAKFWESLPILEGAQSLAHQQHKDEL